MYISSTLLLLVLLLALLLSASAAGNVKKTSRPSKEEADNIRSFAAQLNHNGKNADLIDYLRRIENQYGDTADDSYLRLSGLTY